MTPIQIYNNWRDTLKEPDDSIFYYHPSLDRIMLGLAMYELASRPYLSKLKRAEALSIYNIYINEAVTAWIDDDGKAFEYPFLALMPLCQAFNVAIEGYKQKGGGNQKVLRNLQYTFLFWVPIGGDMSEDKAERLLDDITTDGERIESGKISALIRRLQPEVIRQGYDLDLIEAITMVEKADI